MNAKADTICAISVSVFALCASATLASDVIFSHTFDEGTGWLNGTTVDVGTGSWVAANVVTANGVFATGPGSATLAFSPVNGFVYDLDARIIGITGDGNWVALGFASGQSTAANTASRFITTSVMGTAWSLVRGDNSAYPNHSYNGTGTGPNGGLTSGTPWTTLNNNGGSIDLRIQLDTTGGSGNWTVTWLAKLTTDTAYTTVHPTADALNEASFTSVGFAFSSGACDGTIQSFSLATRSPPTTLILVR